MNIIKLNNNETIESFIYPWSKVNKHIHELCILFCSYKNINYESWMETDAFDEPKIKLYEWMLFIIEESSKCPEGKGLLQDFITMLELFKIPYQTCLVIKEINNASTKV